MEYGICAALTLASALLGTGFSLAAVRRARGQSREYAAYMLARSLALVGLAAVPLGTHAPALLGLVTAAMGLQQLIDGAACLLAGRGARAFGPWLLAACHLACLVRLAG